MKEKRARGREEHHAGSGLMLIDTSATEPSELSRHRSYSPSKPSPLSPRARAAARSTEPSSVRKASATVGRSQPDAGYVLPSKGGVAPHVIGGKTKDLRTIFRKETEAEVAEVIIQILCVMLT
jgi:hypothetical protein